MSDQRFQDEQYILAYFQKEVAVVCPDCNKKAMASVDYETRKAVLLCGHCGYNRQMSTAVELMGMHSAHIAAAATYFDASLWFAAPFKNHTFQAFNEAHLDYLERYIATKLREHKDRSHFTLLEKLPKFYHDAKNREALLKLIQKLKAK